MFGQSSVALTSGMDSVTSGPVTFREPGPYSWQASYSGDATNEGAVSVCVAQRVSAPAPLTLTVTRGSAISFGALAAPSDGAAAPLTFVQSEAVTVEVTGASGPWVVTCTVTGVSDGMELSWQLAGASADTWTPFSTVPCYTAPDGGDHTLTFHYRLHVDPAADPGRFAFTVVYEVSPL